MAKTRLDKIKSYDEQIAQINNRKKQEMQRQKADERKARTRRLCNRMGLFEKLLPATIALTDEQFQTFLEKTVANEHGRRTLSKFGVQGNTTPPPAKPAALQPASTDKTPAKTETAQPSAPAPTGVDGGATGTG